MIDCWRYSLQGFPKCHPWGNVNLGEPTSGSLPSFSPSVIITDFQLQICWRATGTLFFHVQERKNKVCMTKAFKVIPAENAVLHHHLHTWKPEFNTDYIHRKHSWHFVDILWIFSFMVKIWMLSSAVVINSSWKCRKSKCTHDGCFSTRYGTKPKAVNKGTRVTEIGGILSWFIVE